MQKPPQCIGCKAYAARGPERAGSIGDTKEASGFHPFFDCANGLDVVWTCPSCFAKVAEASRILRSVFHERFQFIHGGEIAKITEPPKK